MPYRRRQKNFLSGFFQTLLLGAVVGLSFFFLDNGRPAQVSALDRVEEIPAAATPPAQMTGTGAPEEQPAGAPEATLAPTTVFIPTVGVRTVVIEVYLDGVSWDVAHLGTNAGHLQGTAWLDRPGNMVLAGHVELADGRRGIFARIGEVSVGDPIILQDGDSERHYIVRAIERTTPDDLSVLYPSSDDRLTLITCNAYDFFQDAYLERTVVIAERIA